MSSKHAAPSVQYFLGQWQYRIAHQKVVAHLSKQPPPAPLAPRAEWRDRKQRVFAGVFRRPFDAARAAPRLSCDRVDKLERQDKNRYTNYEQDSNHGQRTNNNGEKRKCSERRVSDEIGLGSEPIEISSIWDT
ncbi:hypothetical protein EVAR_102942_1 [Eumeta japonica]|uniref:Uncharacterized protein n=1 Tax=Eumeta variegata TaxID=151549 RepID=A0A4C1UQW5_EUMVA|nr:hypothetical protein EVAR_102942_1 [Eumeta japonica]